MTITEALSSLMHLAAQFLLVPALALMILLVVAIVFALGSLIVELFTERRHFQVNHKRTIVQMRQADYEGIEVVVQESALLKRQREALVNVIRNMGLPDEELFAMAQMELSALDMHYLHRLNFTDTVSKVAPMLGLMCTLIPLGPGIVAMGQGDVETLSQSLLIAFDATVMGLLAAIAALVFSRIRKTWYARYSTTMRALMDCVLEEAEKAREEGVQLPYGHTGDGTVNPEWDEPYAPFGAAEGTGANAGADDALFAHERTEGTR